MRSGCYESRTRGTDRGVFRISGHVREAYGKAIGKGITYDVLQLTLTCLIMAQFQADFEGVPYPLIAFSAIEIDPQYRLSLCVNGGIRRLSVTL